MAVVNVEFRANANFSDLISQVNQANAAVAGLNANFKAMQANKVNTILNDFNKNLVSSGQFTSQTVKLVSQAETFGKALDRQKLSLRQYAQEYKNFTQTQGGMIRELAKQQTMLERSTLVTRGRTASGSTVGNLITPTGLDNSLATKAMQSRKELQILNKVLNDGATSLINWGKNTQWAGRQLTVGMTVPLTIIGGAAAAMAIQVDKALTNVVKVYGNSVNTMMTAPEVKALKSGLMNLSKELAQTYGAAITDTLDLATQLAAAGKTGADLTSSITQTTKLATLGEIDRADAMKATLAIQTAFKESNTELADSINFLNAVENQTSTSMNDLVLAIPKAGPVVRGLGGDVKDLALLMVAMKEGGVPAAEAANAIKSGLASIINPTTAARKELKLFGIDVDKLQKDANGKMMPMILGFKKAFDGLDQFSRSQVIEKVFGKMQFARLSAMFNNLGESGSQTVEVMKLMGASTESLGKIADGELAALQDSISGKFGRALETLKINLAQTGEQFVVLGTKGLQAVNWLFDKFQALPDVVKKAFGGIGLGIAVIGPIIMMTGVIGNFLGYLVKGVAMFKSFGNAGVREYEHLTAESTAAKLAGDLLSQSMYDQSTAAAVLNAEIEKLISSLSGVELAGNGAAASVTTAVNTATGAVAAEHEKQAVINAAKRIPMSPILSSSTDKDAFGIGTLSHFSPTAGKDATIHGIPAAKLLSGGSLVTDPGSAKLQGDLRQGFQAQFISEAVADVDAERKRILAGMIAGIKEDAARARAEILLNEGTTAEGRAQLLPTIEAVKGINGAYVAKLQALALMSGEDLKAFDLAITQDIKTKGMTRQQAIGKAMQTVESGQFETEIRKQIDTIVATETNAITAAKKITLYLDELEAASRAAMQEASAMANGQLGFVNGKRAGYGVGGLILANETNAYYAAQQEAAALEVTAARTMVAAATEQKAAAVIQTEAAVLEEEAAVENVATGGAAGAGGKRGLTKFGKYAGIGLGVGAMSAGTMAGGAGGQVATVAGGVMTGAMLGMMAGPVGAGVGAAIGGLAAALPILIDNSNKAAAGLLSVGQAGELAAGKLGGHFRTLADVQIQGLAKQVGVTKTALEEYTAALQSAPEGSVDANFVNQLKGEGDKNSIQGFIGDKITSLIMAGVKPEDIKTYVAAALIAAGKADMVSSVLEKVGSEVTKTAGQSIRAQIESSGYNQGAIQENLRRAQVAGFNGNVSAPTLQQSMNNVASGLSDNERKSITEFLTNLSATDTIPQLVGHLKDLDGALLPLQYVIPNLDDKWKGFAETIKSNGGETSEVMKLISLNAAGLKLDMEDLTKNPYKIDIMFNTYTEGESAKTAFQGPLDGVIQSLINKKNQKNSVPSVDSIKAANKASEEAQKKHMTAVSDHYDKLIAAEKKKESALQKIQDAEKKRLEREKIMRDSQVSYNEAIASGNFGQAALIKNQMDANKAQWAADDKAAAANDKNASKLQKLEDAKAKAQNAEQARLDALVKAHQNVSVAAASSAKKAADAQVASMQAAQKTIDGIFQKYPGDFGGAMNEILNGPEAETIRNAFVGVGGDINKTLIKTLKEQAPQLSGSFVSAFGANLKNAPWDLVSQAVNAKLDNSPAGAQRFAGAISALEAWSSAVNGAAGNTGTRVTGPRITGISAGNSSQFSTGGHVSGPGGPETDSIPARLSNGEYVIRNAAVNYYGKSTLDAINQRKFAGGGLVQSLAGDSAKMVMGITMAQMMRNSDAGKGIYGAISNPVDGGTTNVARGNGSSRVVGSGLGAKIASTGIGYVGVPYSYTGHSPADGWGCAPFVHYVYQANGYTLPGGDLSNAQYNGIKNHPGRGALSAGDLLFFKYANGVNTQNPINHVGIYTGAGNMVHAANPRVGTTTSSVDWAHYVGAGRAVDYMTGAKNYQKGGMLGMIKPGEFMVNDGAVKRYGTGFMNAVNNQTYHEGGLVTASGPVRGSGFASAGTNEYTFIINGGDNNPQQIADEVMRRLELKQKRVTAGR